MEIDSLTPNTQTKIFSYKKNLHEFINLYDTEKLPNRIILNGPKGIGKSTLAYHLINYIFSKNEEFKYNVNDLEINTSNRSYNLLKNNTHPNFHLIDLMVDKKVIEISQIRKMITYSNKSSFNNKEKIILLDNVEDLNLNSINALLKIVEEPNDNLYFILILDSKKTLLNTLKSRCLKFNLFISRDESISITNKILDLKIHNIINEDLISHYNTPGDYINLIKFSKNLHLDLKTINIKDFLKLIIKEKYYKKNLLCKKIIYKYIELYFLILTNQNNYNIKVNTLYDKFIRKISNIKKFNLDEESFFIEFESKVLNE